MNVYNMRKCVVVVLVVIFAVGIFFAPFMLRDKMYFLFLIISVTAPFFLWQIIRASTMKITLTSNNIIKSQKYPSRTYELKFDEIGMISDDSVWALPRVEMFVFHLIPKEGIKKNFMRMTIAAGFESKLEILANILSKIDKDTAVDQSLLEKIKGMRKKGTVLF